MKGLTHFMTGLAAASFLPQAVLAAAGGNPLYFILGGAFGILPDTIDFKVRRFFARHDMEVIPDPEKPDPKMIAQAVAYAVNRAHLEGKPVNIKLDTVQLGADTWQQYSVRFDVAGQRVVVEYGPVVNTGQTPIGPPARRAPRGEAPLVCPMALEYEATNTIDIFDGPLFRMTPLPDGRVTPVFIPWHREWSHSLAAAALCAAAGGALFGWLAGVVILAAFCAHILADQLGFMGSNLLFPFRHVRATGLGMMHSGEGLPNLVTVWLSCLLIFWNLYRVAPPESVAQLNLPQLLLYAGVIPIGICVLIARTLGRTPTPPDACRP